MNLKSTRELILDAAIDLFSEKGFTESSIRLIANAASVRESTIYHYFPSKQNLLDEIISEYIKLVQINLLRETNTLNHIPTTEEIADILCFDFPVEYREKAIKMLQIIWQEQFRNEKVQIFFKEMIFLGFNEPFQLLINNWSQYYDIKINTNTLSDLINFILVSYSLETCHNPRDTSLSQMKQRTKEIIHSLIDFTFTIKEKNNSLKSN